MILPDLILPKNSNQCWQHSGVDSPDHCQDRRHFANYPYSLSYEYNSRGFRDAEWPSDTEQLTESIWCVGDSFTVGIGSPLNHTWPWLLSVATDTRTINVSMDGASNNWIARQAVKILQKITPKIMVIHWSYLHRREGFTKLNNEARYRFIMLYQKIKDPDWPSLDQLEHFHTLPLHIQNEILNQYHNYWGQDITDDQLRLWHIRSDIEQDFVNTCQCMDLVDRHSGHTRLIHSFVPEFLQSHQEQFFKKLQTKHPVIPEFQRLDLARDKHHYDIKTSEFFVQQILQVLNWPVAT